VFVEGFLLTGLFVLLLAFVAEYVDSTLGMGYGTTLTPVLLLMGFEPLQVVPAVLLSELITGLLAGLAHHSAGNANFRPNLRKNGSPDDGAGVLRRLRRACPRDLKIVILMAACSVIGTLAAVFVAVHLSKFYLKLYIGLMVFAIGLYLLLTRKHERRFSAKKLFGLGLIASFNKGMSGGGYGPVVTGGQILSGVSGKTAVAVTSLAEGLTCLVGFAAYLATRSIVDWRLFPYLCFGAVLSVPLSAYTVKRLKVGNLQTAISALTLGLGAWTLGNLVL